MNPLQNAAHDMTSNASGGQILFKRESQESPYLKKTSIKAPSTA